MTDKLTVALAQITPVWLDRDATLAKVEHYVAQAGKAGARLVAFSEGLVPGYPFWVEFTGGARFNDERQKRIFAHYLDQGVVPAEHLRGVAKIAAEHGITVVLGCMERAPDRGSHSLYCSLVVIAANGEIRPAHRKLVPTYEERLVWAMGDGHGLTTHDLQPFTLGALNCWENWLPLPRAALHAQGENLHVALWPGAKRHTEDITRFIAREGRSYVLSVGSAFGRAGRRRPRAARRRGARGPARDLHRRWFVHRRSGRQLGRRAEDRQGRADRRRTRPRVRAPRTPEPRRLRPLRATGAAAARARPHASPRALDQRRGRRRGLSADGPRS